MSSVNQQQAQQRFNALAAKAQAGDAEAQYALGMVLSRQDMAKGLTWMNMASDGGHALAAYVLGAWHIEGRLVARDPAKGLGYIQTASRAGNRAADFYRAVLLAKGIGGPGAAADWPAAVTVMIGLAREGFGRALSQLGFLCLMARNSEAGEVGEEVLELAAGLGDSYAQFAHGKRLQASGDDAGARRFISLAAKSGHHIPAAEDPLAGEAPDLPPATQAPEADWKKIVEFLHEPPIPELAPRKDFERSPQIGIIPGFLTPEEADYMIATAAPHLNPSTVVDHINSKLVHREYRSSDEMRFSHATEDLVMVAINLRIAAASGEALNHQEVQGVLRYEGGQQYKPHADYFVPDLEGRNPEVERCGQRIKTFLIYLNEGFEGGETEFLKLGLAIKGRKGDGVLFTNVNAAGEPHRMSQHAGRPVTKGVKWLATVWIRDREYFLPLLED